MKKFRNAAAIILVISTILIIAVCSYYNLNIAKVSNDNTEKEVVVNEGSIESIAITLKENNLIKDVNMFKVYVKLNNKTNLKAGTYTFSENMGVKKIVEILEKGSTYNPNEINITFKEGKNIRSIATTISDNTNNTYESVIELMSNESYIDSLIEKYWFLTNDIKNSYIYYPLEGYLFPDTYAFSSKDVTPSEIIEKMLSETEKKLEPYKNKITSLDLSVHEFFTLASIIELEGAKADDRRAVAGVFYNRLNDGWALGSDVTTYYAAKIDDWSYSLTYKELNDCSNKYNTRCSSNTGLPIGPICNPGLESLKATLDPEKHDYYYFVADCKGKVYLNKDSAGHLNTINKLKKEGNWCA